jgi:NAD(P)-dependent dehydrogenase (short-subunit alcohol dehydrogenase family)
MPKSILITGASRGIGHALAITFARAGWTVFAGARTPRTPLLWNASQEFPTLHPLALDVLEDISVGTCLQSVAAEVGWLDVLVNNAAVFPGDGDETLRDLDLSWFAEAVETNVTGVARVTRAALPLLRKSASPRIANISSGAGSISDKEDHHYYPYSVSKAGLNMLTRAMAAEFREAGIVVTAISPGWVRTEMGGENAPLTPEQSARSLYATITGLTMEDTSCFLGRDGRSDEYQW